MPRAINFRLGRGRIRERRHCLSASGYRALEAWVFDWDGSAARYMRAMGARTL